MLLTSASPVVAAEATDAQIVLLPRSFTLTGSRAMQSLVVEQARTLEQGDEKAGDGNAPQQFVGQVRDGVEFASSDENVVRIENGVALPVGDGTATITATVDKQQAAAVVTVEKAAEPFTWSFRNHVQSVLARANCSSGACHGALAGKAGFKLSLRGYDPLTDYYTITRQARGRRIVPSDPGRSLLLTKPTGAVKHKGGLRFRVDSREYQVLAEWIAAGTPAPRDDDARLERLEMIPSQTVLAPGVQQQFLVVAHFTDGHSEDVTRWAKYTSANESVAKVDDNGLVQTQGHGEGAVTAWYLSQVVAATVSVPYERPVSSDVLAAAPRNNFIDELVLARLADLNLPPSPPASDGEFLRRVYLDTIGVLPTADEARAFLADKSPEKRARLIEELLARPEWVDYWAYKWSDLLLVNLSELTFGSADNADAQPLWSYYSWVRNHVEANTPWDEFVRQIVTASGSTLENGATNFYLLHQDPLDLAETTTVAFMGTSINCARCHNHPLEKWTNNQYYAMANLYARVRAKGGPRRGETIVYSADEGELIQPLTGKPQPPTPLDGEPLELNDAKDRRAHLAEWLVSPQNPYFARSITNRVWANFMGVGLVEMIDDMRLTNPPSNPELLDALAEHLVENNFDLKQLMRTILQSATYQRTSAIVPGNEGDERFYSRYYPRRLMAEVMLDALSQATDVPSNFKGYPSGWRAVQMPTVTEDSYFLATFGRPDREVTCECERTDDPSMVQILHISNGDTLNGKLQAKDNLIGKLLAAKKSDAEIVEEVYLAALSRRPTEREAKQIAAVLAETPPEQRRVVLEDLCWGVLSSKEFLFNH